MTDASLPAGGPEEQQAKADYIHDLEHERDRLCERLDVAESAIQEAIDLLRDQYDGAPDGGCEGWPGVMDRLDQFLLDDAASEGGSDG